MNRYEEFLQIGYGNDALLRELLKVREAYAEMSDIEANG